MAKKPSNNIVDRAIEAVAPNWALQRRKARVMLAMSGGWVGGSRTRNSMANFNPIAGAADEEISWDLPTVRARSREMVKNNPVAAGAINTNVTHVVGTGLSMQSRIKFERLGITEEEANQWQSLTEYEFNLWFESTDCDITRTQNGYGLQDLALRSMMESGDVLAPIVSADNSLSGYSLAVQLVEGDRLMNPDRKKNSAKLIDGVEIDDRGAPVKYHISKTHPGSLFRSGTLEFTALPAFTSSGRRATIHLFERKRPGQYRGMPYLAAVIEPLKQIERFTEAELAAAVTNAVHAMFIRMDPTAFGDLFEGENAKTYMSNAMKWDGKLPAADIGESGKVINLLPGEEPVSPGTDRPNVNFDPFVMAILKQVGSSLELPFEVMMKVFHSSYSAARAALLDAWRVFRKRRDFMATYFCQPIFEAWLDEAVATGRIIAPGYFENPSIRRAWAGAVWVGDGPGAIDPFKEIQAAKMRIEEEVSTRDSESIMYDGVPWEIKHRQRVREESARRQAGISNTPMPVIVPEPEDNE